MFVFYIGPTKRNEIFLSKLTKEEKHRLKCNLFASFRSRKWKGVSEFRVTQYNTVSGV